MGLADGEADLVVAHQVLHYLGEPAAAVAEAARLVAPGGKLLIVDFAPHDLEFLRAEHRHRRLGFFDNEIERWAAAGGLGKLSAVTLPPAGPGGLTVKVWVAEYGPGRVPPAFANSARTFQCQTPGPSSFDHDDEVAWMPFTSLDVPFG